MSTRFEVIELGNYRGWAIQITWPDGRKEQLIGVYTSMEAAAENVPTAAKHFLADHQG
ncbi:hypothetical protein [Tardiphaga sp.]|jgi:hypothetical protein|uniref:hypothetical protein n=1 Tax=Tardiphaga sp. TaxID=1926292 RepID=UPI0037D9D68F